MFATMSAGDHVVSTVCRPTVGGGVAGSDCFWNGVQVFGRRRFLVGAGLAELASVGRVLAGAPSSRISPIEVPVPAAKSRIAGVAGDVGLLRSESQSARAASAPFLAVRTASAAARERGPCFGPREYPRIPVNAARRLLRKNREYSLSGTTRTISRPFSVPDTYTRMSKSFPSQYFCPKAR
jgi:hypothetical protein